MKSEFEDDRENVTPRNKDKERELINQFKDKQENKEIVKIPKPKRIFKWIKERITFEITEKDVEHLEDPEWFQELLSGLKKDRNLSGWIKSAMFEKAIRDNDIENAIEKITEAIKYDKQSDMEKMAKMLFNLMINSGLVIEEEDSDIKKITEENMKNILDNKELTNKLKNLSK